MVFFDQSFRIYSHATIALFTVAIVAQRVALQTQFKFKKCTWSALFLINCAICSKTLIDRVNMFIVLSYAAPFPTRYSCIYLCYVIVIIT